MSRYLAAVTLAIAVVHCDCVPAAGIEIKPAPAFTVEQLNALPTDGWFTRGGNLYNQRYSPLTSALAEEAIVTVVNKGRNDMPPFGAALSPQQMRNLAAYVLQLVGQ